MKRGMYRYKRGMYRNKKAQFYIFAALIISAVIIGIALYTNYAKTKKDTRLYDLGNELDLETGYVYDYGVYKKSEITTDELMSNWTDKYLDYIKDKEIIEKWFFVYGNENELRAMAFFSVETGSIGIGSSKIIVNETKKKEIKDVRDVGGKVNVEFQELNYEFKLEKGENFFFIISSEGYVAGVEE